MPLQDDAMVKIMSTLGLNYGPAEAATKSFENRIASLNKQLFDLKALAISGARNINQAFSSQIGSMGTKDSITNMSSQYAKSNVIFDQHGNILKKVKMNTDDLGKSYKSVTSVAKQHSEAVQDVAKKYNVLGSEMQRRASWFVTGGLFYGGINAAKEAVQSISQVEYAVNAISRVMQDATLNTKEYRDTLLQIGVDYGQSFDNVQKVAFTWATAGFNAKDSIELTKTSMLAMTTAEMDATQATTGLVAIMSQWGLTTKDLLPLLDKINKVADTQVISSGDLINGLAKSSATAKNFGLTLDQTIGYLSIMKDSTGALGKELGNAFKSILSYTQRPGALKVFESLGIDVFADKAKTQFKSADNIWSQIATKWPASSKEIQDGFIKAADDAGLLNDELTAAVGMQETWNDVQKRDISQASGGVYRRTYFQALIQNLGGLQKVYDAISKSAGYSEMENAQRMETLQAKYESLKTAATQLAVAIGDAGLLGLLKGLSSGLTDAAEGFGKLDPVTKDLIINFALVLGAMKALKAVGSVLGFDGILTSILNLAKGQIILNNAVKSGTIAQAEAKIIQQAWVIGTEAANVSTAAATVQQKLFAVAAKGSTLSTIGLNIAMAGLTLGIPLLISGIITLINHQSELQSNYDKLIKKTKELTDEYTQNQEAAAKSSDSQLGEVEIANRLVQELDDLSKKANKTTEEKTRMATIIDQLNTKIPNLKLAVNSLTGELNMQTTAIYGNVEAYKQLLLTQASEKQASAAAESLLNLRRQKTELEKQVIDLIAEQDKLNGQTVNGSYTKGGISYDPNAFYAGLHTSDKLKAIQQSLDETNKAIADAEKQIQDSFDFSRKNGAPGSSGGATASSLQSEFSEENLKSLLDANKISLSKYLGELRNIKKEKYSEYINMSAQDINDLLNSGNTAAIDKTKAYLSLENAIQGAIDKGGSKKYNTNEAYQAELAALEHRKNLNQESAEQEVNNLKLLGIKYRLSADERMDLEERVYNAEQALRDKRLQNSIDWINKEKELGRLSATETIAAWNRVLAKQKDNAEAVKAANKGIFDAYKELLNEQQDEIQKAYNDRMDKIDAEAKRQKKAQQDIIDGIDAAKKALDRSEASTSHEQKIADLQKELAYWSVRTSEEARRKVAEITQQIAEEEYNRSLELQEQELEDQKQAAQDEIDNIEEKANDEKEKLQTAYKEIESAFSDHGINIIALAAKNSKKAYEEWVKNYLIPLQTALQSGSPDDIQDAADNLRGSTIVHDWATSKYPNGMLDQDYKTFKANGDAWAKASAADRVKLQAANDVLRVKYGRDPKKGEYPQFHTGAETLSYGMALFKPGELVFPPGLSTDLKTLIAVASGITGKVRAGDSYSTTDNRKSIKIDKLLNIENNRMEDEVDTRILSRELKRELASLI